MQLSGVKKRGIGKKRGVGQYFRDVSHGGLYEEGEGQHNCRLLQRYFRDVSLPMSSLKYPLKYPPVVLAAGGHVGPHSALLPKIRFADMFDFVSFSLELPPIFKFHSLWLSVDIYSVFQGNCI